MISKRTISSALVLMFLMIGLAVFSYNTPEVSADWRDWQWENIARVPGTVTDVEIGDCDNDGVDEIVACSGTPGDYGWVMVYEWNGLSWDHEYVHSKATWGFTCVEIGDANGDGLNEIAAGTDASDTNIILYSKDTGKWEAEALNTGYNANITDIEIADIFCDGYNEIVFTVYRAAVANVLYMYYNAGWTMGAVATCPSEALAVEVGDVDADGINDVIVGLEGGVTGELRAYNISSGSWAGANIADLPVSVNDIALGDMLKNDETAILIGMNETSNEVRSYWWYGGWIEHYVADVDGNVTCVTIGDAENNNEVKGYFAVDRGYLEQDVMTAEWALLGGYETDYILDDGGWIASGLAVGDVDKDGLNEMVIGFHEEGYNVQLYYQDPDQEIYITSPKDYTRVDRMFNIEAHSNSDYIEKVEFWVNGSLKHVAYEAPYKFMYDAFFEYDGDFIYIEAMAFDKFGMVDRDIIYVYIDHSLDRGKHVNVSMIQPEYAPDQIATAMVDLNTSIEFEEFKLVMNCTDPWGNTYSVTNQTFTRQRQVRVPIMIPSDAALGKYTVNTIGYGYVSGSVVWRHVNITTFMVSGKNTLGWLDTINVSLNNFEMNLHDIRVLVDEINFTTSYLRDWSMMFNDTFTQRMDILMDDLNNIHMSLWDKVNETDMHITDEIRMSMDDIMRMLEEINGTTTMNIQNVDDLRMWLEELLPYLNQTMTDLDVSMSQDITDIKQMLNDMDIAINDGLDDLSAELMAHDQGTNANISELSDKLLGLKGEDVDLSEIMATLDDIEGNLSGDDGGLSQSIADLRTLVTGYRDEIMQKLDEMNGKIDDLATLEEINTELEEVEKKVDSTDQKAASSNTSITMSLVLSVIIAILALICVALLALLVKSKMSAPAPSLETSKKAPPMEEQEDDEVAKEEEE